MDLKAYRPSRAAGEAALLGTVEECRDWLIRELSLDWTAPCLGVRQTSDYRIEVRVGEPHSQPDDPVHSLILAVDGDALPLLTRFCRSNNLALAHRASGEPIDLGTQDASETARPPTATTPNTPLGNPPLHELPCTELCYMQNRRRNNCVAFSHRLMCVGSLSAQAANRARRELASDGSFRLAGSDWRSGPTLLAYDRIEKLADYPDEDYLRLFGRDNSGVRRQIRLRFASAQDKQAFITRVEGHLPLPTTVERSLGFVEALSVPTIVAALVIALSYAMLSPATAATVAAVVLGIVVLVAALFLLARKMRIIDHEYGIEA